MFADQSLAKCAALVFGESAARDKNFMKSKKEIRVSFDTEKGREAVKTLTVLAVIGGITFEEALTDAVSHYLTQPENQKELNVGTWVSQTELIERLKSEYDITTNFQTLLNRRNDGTFNGIYCSDGEKKVFYVLEKVAEKLGEPRTRNKPEKQTAKVEI